MPEATLSKAAVVQESIGTKLPKLESVPRHVAIIMDGNGRWARERGLPRLKGHEQGAESVRAVTEACVELGVEFLTVYAFSTENWKRPRTETDALMILLEHFLAQELPVLMKTTSACRRSAACMICRKAVSARFETSSPAPRITPRPR
jgi:undecaprenyl diphosphate synthase